MTNDEFVAAVKDVFTALRNKDQRTRLTAGIFGIIGFLFAVILSTVPWVAIGLMIVADLIFLMYAIHETKKAKANKKEPS